MGVLMATIFEAAYLKLLRRGALEKRAAMAVECLSACKLCACACSSDRASDQPGSCRTARRAKVASFGAHMGEEDPLRGKRGSGTIFFSNCNMRCQYCQNADISQEGQGREIEPEELAAIMLTLQRQGCHNINFVSPSHVIAQIIEALLIAAQQGLNIPLVYNTGGYDSLQGLELMDGIIDIYMPDMKYADAQIARQYSKVIDYPKYNQAAVREMYHQTGDLLLDKRGVAQRGLLVRHLVLPGGLARERRKSPAF